MKTETSSFRLEKEVFTEFKKHAKKQNITVNALINKVMQEYVEWGALIPAINLIPISATLIGTFLKSHTAFLQLYKLKIGKKPRRNHAHVSAGC